MPPKANAAASKKASKAQKCEDDESFAAGAKPAKGGTAVKVRMILSLSHLHHFPLVRCSISAVVTLT